MDLRKLGVCGRWGVAIMLVSGCLLHKPEHAPSPPLNLPKSYRQQGPAEAKGKPATGKWWRGFRDPTLDRLVERALRGNLDLGASWERLTQAQTMVTTARSAYFPQVSSEVSGSRQQVQTLFGGFKNSLYSASMAASYEIDLFGRIRSGVAAAKLDAQAVRDDVETMAMSVAAQVVESWFDLIEAQQRQTILQRQLDTNASFLELMLLRFRQGVANALDVHQQRQLTAGVRASLALTEELDTVAANRLAVLLGTPDSSSLAAADAHEFPALPQMPAAGLPAELVQHRPDLRAAQRRVEAADYRVAQALAERFPSITLTGSVGLSATSIVEVFESLIWSFIGSVAGDVFDGGRGRATVEGNRAVVAEALKAYASVALQALFEVENALVLEGQQRRHIEALEQEMEFALATLRESRARYQSGLTEYLDVLTAIRAQQSLEVEILAARRQLLAHRVSLHRALGGRWTRSLTAPGPVKNEAKPTSPAPAESSAARSGAQAGAERKPERSASRQASIHRRLHRRLSKNAEKIAGQRVEP